MNADAAVPPLEVLHSTAGVIFVLAGIVALFFWVEARTRWRLFQWFPPLLFIYATPVALRSVDVLPASSPAYDAMSSVVLPVFLAAMLLSIDLGRSIKLMGRSLLVMLFGSVGVVIGAVVAYASVRSFLPPDAWKLFGALTGSWTGGTGNMAAVAGGLGVDPSDLGVAILADNVVYIVWLPILLGSRAASDRFNRWVKVDPERLQSIESPIEAAQGDTLPMTVQSMAYLIAIIATIIFAANSVAAWLPELPPVLSTQTWTTLLVTTFSLAASSAGARRLPGSRAIGLALVYLFLAGMGARASLQGLDDAPIFVAVSFLWISIHGAACLVGARLLHVDIHTAAIASAANIGGAASAPVVAAHHKESLVPASILMALVGYAAGNYLAVIAAKLCHLLAPT